MQKQVNKDVYRFESYVGIDRWSSYYYQLREILAQKPSSVLEIGVGDHIIGDYLTGHNISYTSADIADDLSPDIVADVTDLPIPDASYDVVCAFEVLEHLPFGQFEKALGELARVSRRVVVLSLPHFGPPIQFLVKIPFLREFRFSIKIPFPRKHLFNGQHYWEIGKMGYSAEMVRAVLKKYFEITREFVPFENQYHHFFTLRKKHG